MRLSGLYLGLGLFWLGFSGLVADSSRQLNARLARLDRAVEARTTGWLLPPVAGDSIAFPGAEGYGAETWVACRAYGIQVLFVTDLSSPTGPGTLHQALEDVDPAKATFIIFRTGGVVYHNSATEFPYDLTSAHNCLRIAGETTPGGPIYIADTIPNSEQYFNINGTQDLIIRYIGLRVDTAANDNCCTPLRILAGQRMMFDHLTVTYGDDQLWSMQPTGTDSITDITMQHSIVGAAAKSNILALGFLDDPPIRRVSFYKSFTAHSRLRNPRMDINDDTVGAATTMANEMEWVNVLVYDVASRFGWLQAGINFDLRGSVYRDAPGEGPNYVWWEEFQPGGEIGAGCPRPGQPRMNVPSVHADDDTILGAGTDYDLFRARCSNTPIPDSIKRGTPLSPRPTFDITPWVATGASAVAVDDSVLADVGPNRALNCDGTWRTVLDPVDSLLIYNYNNDVALAGSKPSDFVGWPTPTAGSACTDTDLDGMPDEFEDLYASLDKNDQDDNDEDPDGDGFWNLDEYLNGTSPVIYTASDGSESAPAGGTYGDNRRAHLVPLIPNDTSITRDTLGEVQDTIVRKGVDRDSVPYGARFRPIENPNGDSAVILTYDTLSVFVRDSAWVDSVLVAWGIATPPYPWAVSVPGEP
jgi:hypothetical protein